MKTCFNFFFLLFSGIIFCQTSNDSIQEKIKITPEVIFKKNVFSEFSISPDGKYFISVLENNLGYELVVIEIDKHEVYQKIPLGKRPVNNIHFINKNRMLLEIAGKIIAIDLDGTNSSMIVDVLNTDKKYHYNSIHKHFRTNNVINSLPKDEEHILIETFNYKGFSNIKKVNIFTGDEEILVNGEKIKMHKWYVDLKGNVKIGFKKDKKKYNFYKKQANSKKWEQLFIYVNKDRYSLKTNGATYLNQPFTFEGFGKEDNSIYLATNFNSDKRKLIKYNIKKNEIIKTVLEDPIYDITDPMLDNSELIYDDSELLGVYFDGASPIQRWLNIDMQKIQIQLNDKFPSFINQIIGFSKNKERLLIKKWNDTFRGEVGIYSTKTGFYSTMIDLNSELEEFRLSRSKIIVFPTEDGSKIQGYFNLPLEKKDKYPLVVIPHGGPWARDSWGFDPIVHFFNQKGYATLKLNYRGSVGYGKKHLLKGVKNINTLMIDDIADGVKFIKNKKNIDKKNIFIYGHSYGGYAAYMSVIRHPKLYNAAVAVSAPSDLKQQMKDYKNNNEYFAFEFWKAALGTKDKNKLKEFSPIFQVDKINTPIFIFHGEKDEIIPAKQAENMNLKLLEKGKNTSIRVINNEGHSLYNSNNIIYILDKTINFFNQNKNQLN